MDMQTYLSLPPAHCLTCGHWGCDTGSNHSAQEPCSATGENGKVCGCTDRDSWVPDSVEAFRTRYHL